VLPHAAEVLGVTLEATLAHDFFRGFEVFAASGAGMTQWIEGGEGGGKGGSEVSKSRAHGGKDGGSGFDAGKVGEARIDLGGGGGVVYRRPDPLVFRPCCCCPRQLCSIGSTGLDIPGRAGSRLLRSLMPVFQCPGARLSMSLVSSSRLEGSMRSWRRALVKVVITESGTTKMDWRYSHEVVGLGIFPPSARRRYSKSPEGRSHPSNDRKNVGFFHLWDSWVQGGWYLWESLAQKGWERQCWSQRWSFSCEL
jgi:hypothetical protein